MNKFLSKNLIFDISLSEEHCTAIDFNNCLYTWGFGANNELGYFDKNEKIVSIPNKVMYNNKPFLVEKIKCGKNFTAGITNEGIPFLFGNNDIIFFSFEKNFDFCNIIAKDIFCGENYVIILFEKEKLFIYSFTDGLFEIVFNNNKQYQNKIIISKINILDKNFYVLDERNKKLYEFIYQSKSYNKPFNIKDFFLNEYDINNDVKLSIIEMPFFVKFLFFWIECSENQKKNFESHKNKMFIKISDKNINCFKQHKNKGPYINESFLFGNNNKKFELKKIEFDNNYKNKNLNAFTKGNTAMIKNKRDYNNIFNHKNENENVDSIEESLNLPISKNYGNKNDVKDKKNMDLNFEKINNNINSKNKNNTINIDNDFNKISSKRNSKRYTSTNENRKKYSITLDKNRSRRTIDDYHEEEDNNETIENKLNNNKTNKRRKNYNSFLLSNKPIFNTNIIENSNNNNTNNNYIHIPIQKSKRRSSSQIKDNINNRNSKTINHEEENDFDSILRNINNRKYKINHPIKLEDQVPSTKKILSQIGRKKSKTEMLIKELHETFFGKEKNKDNLYNNYLNNNYIRNTTINKEETKEDYKTFLNEENKKDKKVFKLYRNNDKTEIKLKESKSTNIFEDEMDKNNFDALEYNQKKEIEIDINKVLGLEKKKKNKLKENLCLNENEKTIEEKEKLNKELELKKEKLEKEIEEIKIKKEEEYFLKEKLEKECIEVENKLKNKIKQKQEESKIKRDFIEKELRKKLENEYKIKYDKEKKDNLEQRKNLVITSEINKFIGGNNNKENENKNLNINIHNKFLPEKLKTENEDEFVMKGINKKNNNFEIANNQQIKIENQVNKEKNEINQEKENLLNNNNEFNLNIDDITSTRDIFLENHNILNNNISQKIDNLISPTSPLALNESKLLSKNVSNNYLIKQQSITISDLLNKNKTSEKANEQNKDTNNNSLKFEIENNKIKSDENNDINIEINKEKEDSFEMANLSNNNKEKELNIKNINNDQENEENELPETVLELDSAKKKIIWKEKEKQKSKKRINEIIEEKQELESLEDTTKSKTKTKSICFPNNTNNNNINTNNNINNTNSQIEKSLIPMAEISTNNMRHISTFDQNIISSIRKFEPKELDDITGSLRFFSNRSDNIIISSLANKNINKPASQRTNINNNLNINSNNSSCLKPYIGLGEKNKNIYDLNNLNISKNENKEINAIINNENIQDQKMKIDDLEQSKLLSGKHENSQIVLNEQINEVKNKLFEPNKIIKLKNKVELSNILNEIQKEDSLNDSLYFLLENDLQMANMQTNKNKDFQLLKVKNNKITELNSGNNLILNSDNDNKSKIFHNKLKYIRNYNLINKESTQNYHTFSEKQNLIENNSLSKNTINQRISTNIEENKTPKYNNIIRGIQIKKMNRNKSYGKQINPKQKKKMGLIEQIKKEQYEKKQQIIYNTFNNKSKKIYTNNNLTNYINIKPQKPSKNSVANIGYNNMFHYDQGMIPININMNMNIMHNENSDKNNNNINNKKEVINIKLNHNTEKEKDNNSFIILRKKYLDFLIKTYGNDNIPINNEKEKIDNIFLEGLINNEVPIENINLNLLKCSNDMKNFIGESLENFKLQQIKEKMAKINDSNFLYLNTINNEKMQLDYDDDIKDKSNILEPIELDKSNNYYLNFRKSFVESLRGIKKEEKYIKTESNTNK